MSQNSAPGQPPQPDGTLPTRELASQAPVEHSVPLLPKAPPPPPEHGVGPRRSVPRVPEGPHAPDPDPSPPVNLRRPERQEAAPPPGGQATNGDLTLLKVVSLDSTADNNAAASTDEPSVATNGDIIFYTGNWYAALSTDGGTTFGFVDPFHAFPDPPGMGFCCDQVTQYISQIDTFVWLLQYSPNNATNENIQRLAFATTAQIQQGQWRTFDITPQSLGLPNTMLDFPDLAVGTNMLYVTTNGFSADGTWNSSSLVRIPLSGIANGNITAEHTISTENFSFRVAQNGGTRAFWASHNNTSSLRVFQWDEGAGQPSFNDITVAQWAAPPYQSLTPDGFNWLQRADERILGATMVGSEVWFSWGANSGGVNQRPNPYVQAARIDTTSLAVLDNFNLWDPTVAIAYAALTSNADNEVGASYMFGGGGSFPSHAVGILTGAAAHVTTVSGSHGPADGRWGDYLTIRRHQPDTKLFAATGYTLQRGSDRQDGAPSFILFRR